MMDFFIIHMQLLTSQNINWWTGFVLLVNYCDICISCLDSHCDGTHSLQMIHWWTSDMMLNFSKSFSMKKQINLHLGCLRVNTFSANLEFWVNYSLNIFGKTSVEFFFFFIPQKVFYIGTTFIFFELRKKEVPLITFHQKILWETQISSCLL